jgi:predicted mannosyl-3-phosphoglycerate phosphatase (HAD superfamily)
MATLFYEIYVYKTREDYDSRNFEVWDTGYLSLEAALATAKGKKLSNKYAAVKVQSSDREEIVVISGTSHMKLTNNRKEK